MSKPGWMATAQQSGKRYQDKLEQRPWIAFPLDSLRRFNRIEGKHLALVIALNLFVAVIPLMIIGYAFVEAFNPHHRLVLGLDRRRDRGLVGAQGRTCRCRAMEELSGDPGASAPWQPAGQTAGSSHLEDVKRPHPDRQ